MNLTVWKALILARRGIPVRRAAWSNPLRWIVGGNGLFYCFEASNEALGDDALAGDGTLRPVRVQDFGKTEFLCSDWTPFGPEPAGDDPLAAELRAEELSREPYYATLVAETRPTLPDQAAGGATDAWAPADQPFTPGSIAGAPMPKLGIPQPPLRLGPPALEEIPTRGGVSWGVPSLHVFKFEDTSMSNPTFGMWPLRYWCWTTIVEFNTNMQFEALGDWQRMRFYFTGTMVALDADTADMCRVHGPLVSAKAEKKDDGTTKITLALEVTLRVSTAPQEYLDHIPSFEIVHVDEMPSEFFDPQYVLKFRAEAFVNRELVFEREAVKTSTGTAHGTAGFSAPTLAFLTLPQFPIGIAHPSYGGPFHYISIQATVKFTTNAEYKAADNRWRTVPWAISCEMRRPADDLNDADVVTVQLGTVEHPTEGQTFTAVAAALSRTPGAQPPIHFVFTATALAGTPQAITFEVS